MVSAWEEDLSTDAIRLSIKMQSANDQEKLRFVVGFNYLTIFRFILFNFALSRLYRSKRSHGKGNGFHLLS